MHRGPIDTHGVVASPIQRVPPGARLAAASLILVAIALVPRPWAAWALSLSAVVLLAVAVLSKIGWRLLLRRTVVLGPFVIGVVAMALFQPNGPAAAAFLAAKSVVCLFVMVLLTQTTPFADILLVLRRIGAPTVLLTVIALMYRYLLVLVEEADRLRRARRCRTFSQRRWPTWNGLASVAGQLFVRSSERADRVYAAMCARGWR